MCWALKGSWSTPQTNDKQSPVNHTMRSNSVHQLFSITSFLKSSRRRRWLVIADFVDVSTFLFTCHKFRNWRCWQGPLRSLHFVRSPFMVLSRKKMVTICLILESKCRSVSVPIESLTVATVHCTLLPSNHAHRPAAVQEMADKAEQERLKIGKPNK